MGELFAVAIFVGGVGWFLMRFLTGVAEGFREAKPARKSITNQEPPRPTRPASRSSADPDVPMAIPPSPPSQQDSSAEQSVHVTIQGERRVRALVEDVKIPSGVTVRMKRERTIEHRLEMDWASLRSVQAGFESLVRASVQKALQRRIGGEEKRTETVAYDVELNGIVAQHYRLVWTDVSVTGFSLLDGIGQIPFEYVERTQLDIVPVTGDDEPSP